MMSKFLLNGVLVAFLATLSVATAAEEPRANVASKHFRAKQVLGTKIMIQGDTAVGTVDDLVFDDAGNLEYMVVESNGKLWTVPFDAAKFNIEKRVATLSLTMDQYKTIPTYTTETYPTFYTPGYRTETYKYYNLTPRELRRIERR